MGLAAFPADLLEQAHHLSVRERKKPKQASLRRAVSAAYYALFHLLTIECSANWKGSREEFCRLFVHAAMRDVCKQRKGTKGAGHDWVTEEITRVKDAFLELYELRQKADYDHSKKWTRIEVTSAIETAQAAFHSWRQIKAEPEAQEFLASLFLKRR